MRSKMRRYRPKKMPGHRLVQMQNLHKRSAELQPARGCAAAKHRKGRWRRLRMMLGEPIERENLGAIHQMGKL